MQITHAPDPGVNLYTVFCCDTACLFGDRNLKSCAYQGNKAFFLNVMVISKD